ncbi:MAG: hypothetical protein O7167_02235 [Wolbachia endosymbiont of Andrena nigroaenea]|nr:hypothetical protein [Wolbachia endosymbiont (group A) of Andrena hattorfiana]MDX5526688.1 hypothetical protein [Wolbachia endosymbiont of Andrena nigroaenea]
MRKIQVSRYLDDTYNLVIPVLPPLSSQCLSTGMTDTMIRNSTAYNE